MAHAEEAGAPGSGSYLSPRIPIGGFPRPFETHIENLLVAFNLSQSDLSRPFITQADNAGQGIMLPVSDLAEFILRINAWLPGRLGQFYWLKLKGTIADDSVFETSYWQASHNNVDAEVSLFDGPKQLGAASAPAGTWEFSVAGLTKGKHEFTARYADAEVSNLWTINVVITEGVTIKEAPDNSTLDPLDAQTTLTAVLNYPSQPEDLVSVTLTAEPGTPASGSLTTIPMPVGSMPMEIRLPVSLVAFSIGKKLSISFTYTRGGSAPVTSTPLPNQRSGLAARDR